MVAGVTPVSPDFVINAGVSPGTQPAHLLGHPGRLDLHGDRDIQRGDQHLQVVTEGSPQTVTISANGTGSANLTDTYSQCRVRSW